ncbi:Diphosphomevalonate decarboxylase [Trichoplax sp. H2]|nr:Diphosphomevalonate decarboxylase [Trichoplax sp. H2]|eukprot:RDD44160.1 Diphosphomevalonate decarboxylase [Trichoplax sp. H2]
MADRKQATCIAPVNIAVVKYWGKRDENLILPINSSLSGTLSTDQMCAKTTIAISKSFQRDRLWINGKEQDATGKRLQNCLREVRSRCGSEIEGCHYHICSVNNFPTAAGLASSAAGYACLGITKIQFTIRQGSGSACRSMYGGFVKWEMGNKSDGSDSIAVQVTPETHWPEMEVLILVVSDKKKGVSSTSGMQTSVKTSKLLKYRAESLVPKLMTEMETAIQQKNYQAFAEITMKDSNQFHAVCLDTYPPIAYMNDISHKIVQLITHFNQYCGEYKACYTFDAGPNAVLYVLAKDVPQILSAVCHYFPCTENYDSYIQGLSNYSDVKEFPKEIENTICLDPMPGSLTGIIHTRVGSGPRVILDDNESLLGGDGLPKC